MVDDRHAVADRLHLFHVVAGVDDDAIGRGERADSLEQEGARLRVDADRRLIEEQDPGLGE